MAGKGELSEWRREGEGKQKISKGRKQLRKRKVNGDWWRGRWEGKAGWWVEVGR